MTIEHVARRGVLLSLLWSAAHAQAVPESSSNVEVARHVRQESARSTSADERDLLSVNRRVEKALAEADVEAMKSLLADDFVYIHAGAGVRDTKQSWLKIVPKSKDLYLDRRMQGITTRIYDDTALLSGDFIIKYNTKLFPLMPAADYSTHQLRVFRKDSRLGWRLAYLHVTFGVDTAEQEWAVMRFIGQLKTKESLDEQKRIDIAK